LNSAFLEISFIILLLFANGLFAMTEIAIVSSRKGLLQSMSDKGSKGAAKALTLSENPNRFLSTVQIGITLVGIVAGALGSGTVATRLAEVLEVIPVIGGYAKPVSLAIVIGILTYLSLVVGELVPKRLAMKFPETIASAISGRFTTFVVHWRIAEAFRRPRNRRKRHVPGGTHGACEARHDHRIHQCDGIQDDAGRHRIRETRRLRHHDSTIKDCLDRAGCKTRRRLADDYAQHPGRFPRLSRKA
jgi:CBS domain containing-hemolysin-like protein